MPRNVEVLKVASRSNPKQVAGAIAAVLRRYPQVEIIVVGAGALNQAVKGIAIASNFLIDLELVCVPTFADCEIDGEDRTGIRLTVMDRDDRLSDAPNLM